MTIGWQASNSSNNKNEHKKREWMKVWRHPTYIMLLYTSYYLMWTKCAKACSKCCVRQFIRTRRRRHQQQQRENCNLDVPRVNHLISCACHAHGWGRRDEPETDSSELWKQLFVINNNGIRYMSRTEFSITHRSVSITTHSLIYTTIIWV